MLEKVGETLPACDLINLTRVNRRFASVFGDYLDRRNAAFLAAAPLPGLPRPDPRSAACAAALLRLSPTDRASAAAPVIWKFADAPPCGKVLDGLGEAERTTLLEDDHAIRILLYTGGDVGNVMRAVRNERPSSVTPDDFLRVFRTLDRLRKNWRLSVADHLSRRLGTTPKAPDTSAAIAYLTWLAEQDEKTTQDSLALGRIAESNRPELVDALNRLSLYDAYDECLHLGIGLYG